MFSLVVSKDHKTRFKIAPTTNELSTEIYFSTAETKLKRSFFFCFSLFQSWTHLQPRHRKINFVRKKWKTQKLGVALIAVRLRTQIFFHTDSSLFIRSLANLLACLPTQTIEEGRKKKSAREEREREWVQLQIVHLASIPHARTHSHSFYLTCTRTYLTHARTHPHAPTSLACSGVRFRMKMSQQHFYFVWRPSALKSGRRERGFKTHLKTHF